MSDYWSSNLIEGEQRTIFKCGNCPDREFTASELDLHIHEHKQQRDETERRSVRESSGMDDDKTEKYFSMETKNKLCFLCLNELDSCVISSSSSTKDSRCDNTKNGECQETGQEVRSELANFSLRKIFSYLRLDTGKILDGVNAGSPLLDFCAKMLKQASDFTVLLCKDCCAIAKKLSDLCEKLELLQMEVDSVLRKFHGKLEFSSGIQQFVPLEQVGNKFVSQIGLDLVHAMVADILREKTKEKCYQKLKLPMPRYMPYQTSPEKNLLTTTSFSPQGSIIKVIPDGDKIETRAQLSEADVHQIMSFKLPKISDIPQERDVNNFITCSLCPASANSVFTKELLFQRHVNCCHLDFLFAYLKLPHYSMEQFKAYCQYLLEEELKSSEQTYTNSDQTPGFMCHICGNIFHEVKVTLGHLVLEHHEILAQKLVELQKSTTVTPEELMNQTRFCDIFLIENIKFKCDACGRVFVANSSLSRHQKAPCRSPSETAAYKAINRPFICTHCGVSFITATGRNLHTKRTHLGIKHKRERTSCVCGKIMSISSIIRHKKLSCPARVADPKIVMPVAFVDPQVDDGRLPSTSGGFAISTVTTSGKGVRNIKTRTVETVTEAGYISTTSREAHSHSVGRQHEMKLDSGWDSPGQHQQFQNEQTGYETHLMDQL